MTESIPKWDLSNIYLGLDDPKLFADMAKVSDDTSALSALFENELLPLSG